MKYLFECEIKFGDYSHISEKYIVECTPEHEKEVEKCRWECSDQYNARCNATDLTNFITRCEKFHPDKKSLAYQECLDSNRSVSDTFPVFNMLCSVQRVGCILKCEANKRCGKYYFGD